MKDKFDIYTLSEDLMNKEEERSPKVARLALLEREYQELLDNAQRIAPGASQPLREAQAREVMRTEHKELYEEYFTLMLEVKLLNNRIQVITTICANLRSLGFSSG